jgi:hypothetical protein
MNYFLSLALALLQQDGPLQQEVPLQQFFASHRQRSSGLN